MVFVHWDKLIFKLICVNLESGIFFFCCCCSPFLFPGKMELSGFDHLACSAPKPSE